MKHSARSGEKHGPLHFLWRVKCLPHLMRRFSVLSLSTHDCPLLSNSEARANG
ncbi:hypothetical protein Mapa_008338 [Marchantia paleacea]|nr:hypothetical protein Mapa_008338 [Marchantia paleacea]